VFQVSEKKKSAGRRKLGGGKSQKFGRGTENRAVNRKGKKRNKKGGQKKGDAFFFRRKKIRGGDCKSAGCLAAVHRRMPGKRNRVQGKSCYALIKGGGAFSGRFLVAGEREGWASRRGGKRENEKKVKGQKTGIYEGVLFLSWGGPARTK